jgi:hypothetical protein
MKWNTPKYSPSKHHVCRVDIAALRLAPYLAGAPISARSLWTWGLASAAAFAQTCKYMHSLSEGPAVIYSNLFLPAAISNPDHPFWKWLATRSGRIAGLSLALRLGTLDAGATHQLPVWMPPLQTLCGIPNVQLRVEWVGLIAEVDLSCIAQWLKQHGQLINHLTLDVTDVNDNWRKLKDLCKAIAPCRSILLTLRNSGSPVVDLADLDPVAGSLHSLTFQPFDVEGGCLLGTSAFGSMSQLTALQLNGMDFGIVEPWVNLAKLTSLQQLCLTMCACGDPSPLSALTRLSSLRVESWSSEEHDQAPFSFSSLQPLSTLQQLEELHLGAHACDATSLHGLAGLSNVKLLEVDFESLGSRLSSLEGISPWVVELSMMHAWDLESLAGIEGCSSIGKLSLDFCSVSSLQPLGGLSSLKQLMVWGCPFTSLEDLVCMSLQSLSITRCTHLVHLSGIQGLSTLGSLEVRECGLTSLQPLCQLGEGLQRLCVYSCTGVQEKVLELPHVQPTAEVVVVNSNVREVVLAGGERRVVGPSPNDELRYEREGPSEEGAT